MLTHRKPGWNVVFLGGLLASAIASTGAQTAAPATAPSAQTAPAPAKRPAAGKPYRYHTTAVPKSAMQYYGLMWGVDSLSVKSVESGEIVRFSYRVVDPVKARILNSKKSEPALIDQQAGVSLVVPSLEKVGQLRQTGTPESGKVYWMAFSNKGRKVKPGHRVSVVIGTFRADGLAVE